MNSLRRGAHLNERHFSVVAQIKMKPMITIGNLLRKESLTGKIWSSLYSHTGQKVLGCDLPQFQAECYWGGAFQREGKCSEGYENPLNWQNSTWKFFEPGFLNLCRELLVKSFVRAQASWFSLGSWTCWCFEKTTRMGLSWRTRLFRWVRA